MGGSAYCRGPPSESQAAVCGDAGSIDSARELTALPKDELDDMFAEPPRDSAGSDVTLEASNQRALEEEGPEDIVASTSPVADSLDDGGMAPPAIPAAAPRILRRLDG